jgi:hypothetical protein
MTGTFDAFHLPQAPGARLETVVAGELHCRYPAPTAALVARAVLSLRRARQDLARRSVRDIVAAVDRAAARLADPDDPIRRQADRLIPAATGYSPAMSDLILDRMAADWRTGSLYRLLRAELVDPGVLDGFVAAGEARRTRAYGPDLTFHVFAGNVPGVGVTSLVRSLLVKAPALAKLASGEPVLPVLFARALAEVDPQLGGALAISYWPGGSTEAEDAALQEADAIVVYGGAEAVRSLASRVPPGRRLLVHGPRFSVGLVAREALTRGIPQLARSIGLAVATFDQHGCVSPHAVWVEDPSGERAEELAHQVADVLADLDRTLPRGVVTPADVSNIHQERGAAEMRGHASRGGFVLASAGTGWTVVLDPDPTFRPSCLNRFIRIHPVAALHEAVEQLRPQGRWLQSVALEAGEDRRIALADSLARIGATRITGFVDLPFPPAEWHHDGSGPLNELLRWVDLEG